MKAALLALALALSGCIAGLAFADPAASTGSTKPQLAKKVAFASKAAYARQAAKPQPQESKAPAPAASPLYREDLTLEEMQRYHQ